MQPPLKDDGLPPMEVVPTRDGYDRWAETYDQDDNPLIALEEPLLASLLGDVANLDVVDIGCGTGRHAVRLAAAGSRVTAVDFSEGMVARAQAKVSAQPGSPIIRFIHHDVTSTLPLPGAAFDRVLSCLVLDHVHDLGTAFGEFRRICRPAGSILISVMHPAMNLIGVQARFYDAAAGRKISPASAENTIADYVTAAVRSGLRIEHISEHRIGPDLAARSPRAAKYLGWPILLMMRLKP